MDIQRLVYTFQQPLSSGTLCYPSSKWVLPGGAVSFSPLGPVLRWEENFIQSALFGAPPQTLILGMSSFLEQRASLLSHGNHGDNVFPAL